MIAQTFEKEITFLNPAHWDGEKHITEPVTKKVLFKELSRTDKDQHKLHFMLISVLESDSSEEDKMRIDSDRLYDITSKAVKTLVVLDDNFGEQDKTMLLNDSGALFSFGLWLLKEKIAPFFAQLMTK